MSAEEEHIPIAGEIWIHFRGGRYRIVCLAQLESSLKQCVVYVDLDDPERIWVRPLRGEKGWMTPARIDHTEVVARFKLEKKS